MQDPLFPPMNSGARPPRNPARKPPATNRNVVLPTSTNDSVGTAPTSVHCSSLLVRNNSHRDDMSDLSGSYHHAAAVIPTGDDAGPWRHAPRTRLPSHPQPHGDHDESSFHNRRGSSHMSHRVLLDQASIEVEALQIKAEDDSASRIPAIMLLMDPQRKKYEIMQLWMDPNVDTIREIVQAISRNLGDWKQDYDGLFQVRNNHFSQLIHVLSAGRYDILPQEVWVAKPWSMSAKVTVGYASTLLNHLKRLGALEYKRASDFKTRRSANRKRQGYSTSSNDTVLVLSSKAQQRIYVPEGIMKHHHAAQFLSFVPPFEHIAQVDVGDGSSSVASALSDSLAEEDPLHSLSAQHRPSKIGTADEFSETESTYSTTGTNSPKQKNRFQHYANVTSPNTRATVTSQSCDASTTTRASAYVLRTSRMSPPADTSSEQARGLSRWLRALNCAKSSGASSSSSSMENQDPLLTSNDRPRRLIDSASDVASVSSGAPLLFSTRSDWIADE